MVAEVWKSYIQNKYSDSRASILDNFVAPLQAYWLQHLTERCCFWHRFNAVFYKFAQSILQKWKEKKCFLSISVTALLVKLTYVIGLVRNCKMWES